MNFKQFLLQEALSPDDRILKSLIIDKLNDLGFNEFKEDINKFSSIITILTDENRFDVIDKLLDNFSNEGIIRDKTISGSSIGGVKIGKIKIIVKPKSKQGQASAGKSNEDFICNQINFYASKENPITLKIKSQKVVIHEIENVIGCENTSLDSSNRSKADIEILTSKNKSIPVSIKQSNAVFWESAVTYFRHKAIPILENLLEKGDVELIEDKPGNFKLSRDVAIPAKNEDIKNVVFGKDLLNNNGFVIKQTFDKSDFSFDSDTQELTIEVEYLYENLNDVKENKIHFIIINKTGRSDFSPMKNKFTDFKPCKGLMLRACDYKRVNKTAIVVNNYA